MPAGEVQRVAYQGQVHLQTAYATVFDKGYDGAAVSLAHVQHRPVELHALWLICLCVCCPRGLNCVELKHSGFAQCHGPAADAHAGRRQRCGRLWLCVEAERHQHVELPGLQPALGRHAGTGTDVRRCDGLGAPVWAKQHKARTRRRPRREPLVERAEAHALLGLCQAQGTLGSLRDLQWKAKGRHPNAWEFHWLACLIPVAAAYPADCAMGKLLQEVAKGHKEDALPPPLGAAQLRAQPRRPQGTGVAPSALPLGEAIGIPDLHKPHAATNDVIYLEHAHERIDVVWHQGRCFDFTRGTGHEELGIPCRAQRRPEDVGVEVIAIEADQRTRPASECSEGLASLASPQRPIGTTSLCVPLLYDAGPKLEPVSHAIGKLRVVAQAPKAR
mmetsp:Transcript_20159/g.55580  ORF Transcript_20159/g.55580 Transcript_20159/m.55580 type:complete len:388 (-) Transcript_20159:269-1432(-)